MSSCLLVVNVQHAFVDPGTSHLPERVEVGQEQYQHVAVSRFVNRDGSPFRTILGWSGSAPDTNQAALAFQPRLGAQVFDRETYSAVDDRLLQWLTSQQVTSVDIAGLDTDAHVLATALDLFDQRVVPRVVADWCGSTGGVERHEAGLRQLRRLIGEGRVA